MNQEDYNFLIDLLQAYQEDELRVNLLDTRKLSAAMGRPEEDIRTAALYMMDEFVRTSHGEAVDFLRDIHLNAIDMPKPQQPRRLLQTIARFLDCSRFGLSMSESVAPQYSDEGNEIGSIQIACREQFQILSHNLRNALADADREDEEEQPNKAYGGQAIDRMVVVIHGTWTHGMPLLGQLHWPRPSDWWRYPSPFTTHLDNLSGGAVYKGSDAYSGLGSGFRSFEV